MHECKVAEHQSRGKHPFSERLCLTEINYLQFVFSPERTEVNGCSGSKGHLDLPDSTVFNSSWNTSS